MKVRKLAPPVASTVVLPCKIHICPVSISRATTPKQSPSASRALIEATAREVGLHARLVNGFELWPVEGIELASSLDEALAMIARAAEGSARDGLSILDQAIAHADLGGEGRVTPERVQDMLGLADKSAQRKLLAALLAGDSATLLDMVDAQFALGVEPLSDRKSVV